MSMTSLRVTCIYYRSILYQRNNGTCDIAYSFFPNVGPGYKIVKDPVNLVFLRITLSTISSMEKAFTDQNGKLVNLRGEELVRNQRSLKRIKSLSELYIK